MRSLDHTNAYGRRRKGAVLFPELLASGHRRVTLTGKKQTRMLVHVIVMLAFEGPCPSGNEVLHENHLPFDNRKSNLSYGTRSENIKMDYAAGNRTAPIEWVYSANGRRNKTVEEYAALK